MPRTWTWAANDQTTELLLPCNQQPSQSSIYASVVYPAYASMCYQNFVRSWIFITKVLTEINLYPTTEMKPARNPMSSAPQGWITMLATDPTATPPASVAFWIWVCACVCVCMHACTCMWCMHVYVCVCVVVHMCVSLLIKPGMCTLQFESRWLICFFLFFFGGDCLCVNRER